jgi:hypothetical protein
MDRDEIDRQLKLSREYLDSEIISMTGGTRRLIVNLVFIIDTLLKEKDEWKKRPTNRPPTLR